jgi:hypothetical protein
MVYLGPGTTKKESMHRRRRWVALVILPFLLAGCRAETPGAAGAGPTTESTSPTPAKKAGTPTGRSATPTSAATVPRPDHVVVVVFENKRRDKILGSPAAPYLNKLAASGANLTQSYAVTYPSQPNYLALFSGSTQNVRGNDCPTNFPNADNLGHQLLEAGLSFIGYAESLPSVGYRGCESGRYERKHNPWVNFGNLPASVNQPFSAFPADFASLPTVAFVAPNMCSDMHDCSVATGDRWLRDQLGPYAEWAKTHNSLLIVTFDEDDGDTGNHILTLIAGEQVRPGSYDERTTHYTILRTIEDAYGLPPLGQAAKAEPLKTIWTSSPPVNR